MQYARIAMGWGGAITTSLTYHEYVVQSAEWSSRKWSSSLQGDYGQSVNFFVWKCIGLLDAARTFHVGIYSNKRCNKVRSAQ